MLQRIRTHGDWPAWLRYFLIAVRDTARSAIDQSQAILNLRDAFRQKLDKRHRALTLVDDLFINPYTTVARAASSLGVTAPTASKTIRELERAGILKEVTGREWGRFWLAEPILNALAISPGPATNATACSSTRRASSISSGCTFT